MIGTAWRDDVLLRLQLILIPAFIDRSELLYKVSITVSNDETTFKINGLNNCYSSTYSGLENLHTVEKNPVNIS